MKKNLLTLLLCIGTMAAFNTNSNGQVLVQYWNFNNFTTAINLPAYASLAADYSILDTAKARWVDKPSSAVSGTYASYSDFVTDASDTVNAQMGAMPGNAFRARNPNDSMEILIYMPSTGYTNLVLSYATQSSSYTSGDSIQVFSYSNDSGTTWITSGSGLSEWVDSAQLIFTKKTITINDAAAYNNAKLVFRIKLVGRNFTTSGNNRFDNVALFGLGAAGVAEIQHNTAYHLYPNPVMNNLDVLSTTDGEKSVRILNVIGQTLYTGTANGSEFSISTANLTTGNYFISIRENATGDTKTMRFTKQ